MTKYYGDGSGRDNYIIKDNGGLLPGFKDNDYLKTFYNSLRKHPRVPNPNKILTESERRI